MTTLVRAMLSSSTFFPPPSACLPSRQAAVSRTNLTPNAAVDIIKPREAGRQLSGPIHIKTNENNMKMQTSSITGNWLT